MAPDARSRFPFYLAAAWTLLAIYGSLYPFSGWRDSGVPLIDFLVAGWPRYTTTFDLATNVAAYVPLGFLWVPALRPRLPVEAAVVAAILLGIALSLGAEMLQNFLPSRVPSNLDLACNAFGALIGALAGARWGRHLLDGGRLHALRTLLFLRGTMADAGLLLLLLWLLTQFNPETLLFGNGDLRALIGLAAPLPYSAQGFARVEAGVVAAHTLAALLLSGLLVRQYAYLLPFVLLLSGLAGKSFAFMLLAHGPQGFAWATPGSLTGLALGVALWLAAGFLGAGARHALAALALSVAAVLVNLVPDNPYHADNLQSWHAGQFLNFHGLTKIVSSLWPYLALPWIFQFRRKA